MKEIRIRMLGEFSLEAEGVRISDSGKRSRKMWGLLAYFICGRKNFVRPQKLIDMLYGDDPDSVNPENALRITMHRMRSELDALWPGAGKELIVFRDGGYGWNPAVEVWLDYERFEEVSLLQEPDPETRLAQLTEALGLYGGEFLPRYSEEGWVMPVATHFHDRFVEMTMEAAHLLTEQGRHAEGAALCRRAISQEPYHEPLHQLLMLAMGAMGDVKGVSAVFEGLRKRLMEDFGIQPSEQTREIYRTSSRSCEGRDLPVEEVMANLREKEKKLGALVCDYDYFKLVCQMNSRVMERSGQEAYVVLLSLSGSVGQELTKGSRERVLEVLGEHFRKNLRRSDVIARCSSGQYILMLSNINNETAHLVIRRVLVSFRQAYAKVAVTVNYVVRSLTPDISVP